MINVKKMIKNIFCAVIAAVLMLGLMPLTAVPVYAADPVYDITFYHDSIYGEGEAGHLKGSSTDWEHPTWGNDTWVGSARLRPKVYYEAGNDHFTLKVNISRMNGSHQPGGNYVSGTVKYNGHTITFENWGPFGCGSNWVDIRFERTAITFNYNGGRNHTQGTNNISADYYWYNADNFSIVDTYNGKNFDIENQPYWTAYPPVSSDTIFDGWWTEPEGGTRITTEDITKLSGTMTLYAHWKPYHLVQLVGGSNVTPSRGYIDVEGSHTTQVVQGEEMEPVTFTANEGYHIDHNSIDDVMQRREGTDKHTENGVTVERISDTQYVAYGTPTGQVHIWIPNGHKYEGWTTTTAATCTTAGAKERVCKYDATIKETAEVAIDPNAHSWGEWTIKEPTCSAPGEKTRVCQYNAEHMQTEEGDPINPDAHSYKFVDFTWTGNETDGYTEAVANYVCENNSEHKTTAPATVSEGVVTDPTCEVGGKTTYTATVAAADSPDGEEHTDSKDAKATDPIDHKWKFTEFIWTGNETDGYTAATANYVCENDETHTTTVDAVVNEAVTDPTCTEPGKTTYTATVAAADSPDGKEHTDSKDAKATDPIEHKWKFTEFTWTGNETDGYTAATANYVCENDDTHKTTKEATISDEVTDPTCTEPGKTTFTATITAADSPDGAEHSDSKDAKPTDPIEHKWKFTEFTWTGNETEGYTAATANYVCENDESHTNTAEATISDEVTDPTCTEPGKTTYTATIAKADSLDGKEHTDSKDAKATDPIEHKWKFTEFTWTGDKTEGYTAVKATYVCENDPKHETAADAELSEVVTDPTCTEPGKTTYTATITAEKSPDGAEHSDSKDAKATDPLNHKWKFTDFTWTGDETEGYTAATANYVCENDESHTNTADATISDEVTYPTCTEPGKTTYTATVAKADSPDGAEHTESKDAKPADPVDHDWDEPVYEWAKDNSSVTATRICKRDEKHIETETADTTSEVTKQPTCTEKGDTTYTSNAFENPAFEVQTKTVTDVDALGHKWGEWTQIKAPTCDEKGLEERVCMHDETHKETRDVDALGHEWGEWVVTKEATETEEGIKTRTCARDASHTETKPIPKVKPEEFSYSNTKGDGGTWTKGSDKTLDFTFKRSVKDDETFDRFTGIEVDGKPVAAKDYTAEAGSVVIKLNPAYLEKLAAGKHNLTANFDDGSAKAAFSIKEEKKEPPIGGDYYPVTWDPNGGTLSDATYPFEKTSEKTLQPVYKGGELEVLAAPSRDGYTFLCWECDGKQYKPGEKFTVEKKDMVFTAKWKEKDKTTKSTDKVTKSSKTTTKQASTTKKSAKTPKTGDENQMMLWTVVIVAAAATVILVMRRKKYQDR